ncbi:hypothetical protein ACHHYP_06648 [Achlya hypogyna]|uniref:TAZ-type domain-containing protein n=1 Tax=Achlya hypogyna TaxID=1202772 RepID=A0A1V9YSQ7_ACHHY|nr:hypothetical protein ACHHYP_06648 [Achlya hypogyna]
MHMALLQHKKRRLYEDEDEVETRAEHNVVSKKVCMRPNPVLQTEKMQSVLRGLEHVSTCQGCANKLCASTLAFVKKVQLHLATAPTGHDRLQCAACKLWTLIVTEHVETCDVRNCLVPLCAPARPRLDDPPIQ